MAGVILLYHHVDESTPAITSISPDQFERHLEIIEEAGFTVVPLDLLVKNATSGVRQKNDVDTREVAITFDDAYASIYKEAFPRLKQRGWPFTIFVSPAFVRDNSSYYLSWSQLREMAKNDVSIQNHSLNHHHLIRRLEGESEQAWQVRVTTEITESAEILAREGFETSAFAYPYGEYDLALLELIDSLDLTGYGQQSGAVGRYSDPRLLPRFPLAGIYVGEAAFRDKLNSLPMPVKVPPTEPLVGSNLRPPLSLNFVGGSVPTRLNCFGPGGLMSLTPSEPATVTVLPAEDVPVGRSRYNCTFPKGKRFAWFSQLWIRKMDDGSWYPES